MNETSAIWTNQSLDISGLTCRRGGRTVFEGLAFSVASGGLLHLRGQNGSGKTTLLRALAGLLKADSGTITYCGEELGAGDIGATGQFLYSGHQHGLKKMLTLRENCEFLYGLMTGHTLTDDRLFNAAGFFGLDALIDQPVKYFSSGQLHRASLMRFCLLERPLWLMDEPTVGLDAENRQRLAELMANHIKRGGVIIAASHDPLGLETQELDMAGFQPMTESAGYWA